MQLEGLELLPFYADVPWASSGCGLFHRPSSQQKSRPCDLTQLEPLETRIFLHGWFAAVNHKCDALPNIPRRLTLREKVSGHAAPPVLASAREPCRVSCRVE